MAASHPGPSWWTWIAPWATAVVLSVLSVVIWQRQVQHERQLLAAHTEDIAQGAAQRLELYVESRLAVAEIFAKRWSTHEDRDFSRRRFEEFARLIIDQVPGYGLIGLSPSGHELGWTVPPQDSARVAFHSKQDQALLWTARQQGRAVLSEPVEIAPGKMGFYAFAPLLRGTEFLGFLWIEFDAETLMTGSFDPEMPDEFQFTVADGETVLVRHQPEAAAPRPAEARVSAAHSFDVANRTWTLTLAPRPVTLGAFGGRTSWPILALGLTMSLGLAALMFLLSRRIEAHLRARDAALREVEERKRAERTARSMEERYRGVFEHATDGLLVLSRHGIIAEANRAASAMHGVAHDELIGVPIQELIAEEHRHRWDEFVERLEEVGTVAFESTDVRKDGSRVDVEVRGTRFLHRGKPAMLAILSDVSDRNAAMRQQLQLSRKVLVAQEEERARVSRDLHDGLGQLLTALRFELDWIGRQGGGETGPCGSFAEANRLVESAADELRGICEGLRPPLLDELGLESAVRELTEDFQARNEFTVDLDLRLDDDQSPVPPEVALSTYRVLQETLHNVRRHADAHHVSISLATTDVGLKLTVYDDGRGFDPEHVRETAGLGIAGMRERARLVGGSIEIRSARDEGTRVVLRVPLRRPPEEETP